jgi:hypothetical protein
MLEAELLNKLNLAEPLAATRGGGLRCVGQYHSLAV